MRKAGYKLKWYYFDLQPNSGVKSTMLHFRVRSSCSLLASVNAVNLIRKRFGDKYDLTHYVTNVKEAFGVTEETKRKELAMIKKGMEHSERMKEHHKQQRIKQLADINSE